MFKPYFQQDDFRLYEGDCNLLINCLDESVDLIFADPPYFLSNNGFTIQSGEIVSVNKGKWDVLSEYNSIDEFNYRWIENSRKILKNNGTIWISGTVHNIFSIVKTLNELNFKILNSIIWQKTNPPPNFSTRCFTHSTEIIIWARKDVKIPHYYNYRLMKELNGGKQMKDVWSLPAIAPWEKKFGKHPTQKPLSVLSRLILASSKKESLVLDPFCGSGTTGIAANLFDRRFIGIDIEKNYLDICEKRYFESKINKKNIIKKIKGIDLTKVLVNDL